MLCGRVTGNRTELRAWVAGRSAGAECTSSLPRSDIGAALTLRYTLTFDLASDPQLQHEGSAGTRPDGSRVEMSVASSVGRLLRSSKHRWTREFRL